MRSTRLFAAAALMLAALTGCQKESLERIDLTLEGTPKHFIAGFESETRTVVDSAGKTSWKAGDVIRYYSAAGGSVGTATVENDCTNADFVANVGGEDSFFIAEYGGTGITNNTNGKSFTITDAVPDEQTGRFEDAHVAVSKTYVELGERPQQVTFKNITSLIEFTLERTDVAKVIFTSAGGENLRGNGDINISFKDITATPSFAGDCDSTIVVNINGAGTFYIATLPVTLQKGFTMECYNAQGTLIGVTTGKNALTLKPNSIVNLGKIDGRIVELVDLGLSVKWATCNLGATNPEEYGRYFAWEDTVGQSWDGSSWSGSSFSTYPSYELDANNNLKPEYDAAHVLLGGSWRMPTESEFTELIDNCTCTWTSDYNGTGIAGRIFTSKKTGYTDKSIFLPAAGDGYFPGMYTAGSYGIYWSSSINTDYNYNAGSLYFYSSGVFTDYTNCYYELSVRPVSGVGITSVTISHTLATVSVGETKVLSAAAVPSNADKKDITWSSSNESIATVNQTGKVTAVSEGTATITAKAFNGIYATCTITVKPLVTYVDLGLSVKWATCNLGATKPEEYGRYFAWADTVGQSWDGSSWSGRGFSTSPSYELDANNSLKPEYDAANVLLGGSWRMPTKDECQELIDNCTCTWISNYNGTGVSGRIFTSKKTGYTDKSIFLPAAGSGFDSYLDTGLYGHYWSSSIGTDNAGIAGLLLFYSSYVSASRYYYRYFGLSIRPVSGVGITSVTISDTLATLSVGETKVLLAAVVPTNADKKDITWSSSNESVATVDQTGKVTAISEGTATITAKAFNGIYATCTITVKPLEPYVDLGLSVKWATCNLGADYPEEYGRYFAWGDVVGQTWDGSSWSGAGFSTYPSYELNANNNLKPEYDAAHVLLGGTWRMPTKSEFTELIDNCTCTWTSDYNCTGVAGRIYTSKKAGYTDKSIFLPAAGSSNYSNLSAAGVVGYYWSSSVCTGSAFDAWYLNFYSSYDNAYDSNRCYGQSIRPVLE